MTKAERTYYAQLGKFVRAQRLQLGLSLREVAEMTGFSIQHLSHIEHGRRRIPADKTSRLLAALGTTHAASFLGPEVAESPGKEVLDLGVRKRRAGDKPVAPDRKLVRPHGKKAAKVGQKHRPERSSRKVRASS